MKNFCTKKALIGYVLSLAVILFVFALSILNTRAYNHAIRHAAFDSSSLFAPEDAKDGRFTVNAAARSSTWTKAFDLNNEGLTEHNYQA